MAATTRSTPSQMRSFFHLDVFLFSNERSNNFAGNRLPNRILLPDRTRTIIVVRTFGTKKFVAGLGQVRLVGRLHRS